MAFPDGDDGSVGRNTRCFVISPIGERQSKERQHADEVLKSLIEPALRKLSLTPIRSDQIAPHGMVSSQMFDELLHDRLCIAILTGSNANVFYEVAIAQCARRPLVLLIEKGEALPFDLKDHRAVQYSLGLNDKRE